MAAVLRARSGPKWRITVRMARLSMPWADPAATSVMAARYSRQGMITAAAFGRDEKLGIDRALFGAVLKHFAQKAGIILRRFDSGGFIGTQEIVEILVDIISLGIEGSAAGRYSFRPPAPG